MLPTAWVVMVTGPQGEQIESGFGDTPRYGP
jgi:hypothetical protein